VQHLLASSVRQESDGFLMPTSDSSRRAIFLIFGIIFLVLAVTGTCTGKAWARYGGGVIRRTEEPKRFWGLIASQYFMAAVLIGLFLS
jgi:hypothetical protein